MNNVGNIDNLRIDGDAINNYMYDMLTILNNFIDDIGLMKSYEKKLVWESNNRDMLISDYNKDLKEYYDFANNAYKIVAFLESYVSEYSDHINEIKIKLDNLANKFKLGDEYE